MDPMAAMRLDGRLALITGAAGHVGREAADTLAVLGADLILSDREGDHLEVFARELGRRRGVSAKVVVGDLECDEDRLRLVDSAGDSLSILLNNAAFVGTSNLDGWAVPLEEQSLTAWRRALEVNLTAAFDLTKALAPVLRTSPGASVINVASIYGLLGPDWGMYEGTQMGSPAAYAASKGGLVQLTRWLATTVAPDIRVNAIAPGGIERGQPEDFQRRYVRRTPMARMATAADLQGAIAYLASDLSGYVTGQILAVDGGWSAW